MNRPQPPRDVKTEKIDWREIKPGDVIYMTTSLYHQRIEKFQAIRPNIADWWILHDLETDKDVLIKVKHNDTWRVLDE